MGTLQKVGIHSAARGSDSDFLQKNDEKCESPVR